MRQNRFLARWAGHVLPDGSGQAPARAAGDRAGIAASAAGPATRAAADQDTADPDAALAAALRSGTPQAARQLYEAYAQPLHRFVHRQTGDPELAQDVVQDVMVRVWQAAPRFDPDLGTFRAWVFRIARNVLTDEARRAGRRPRVVAPLEWHDREDGQVSAVTLASVGDPAGDEVEAFLRSWVIQNALDRLPAEHRTVVELVHLRQLTVAQAAERLGIPEGTVKSRCFYALQNLRTAFQELGVVQHDL
ncbi:MAG TPA: sigma-70 family RNA polymerase sigma factor [Kineosporiaceae bacterium]